MAISALDVTLEAGAAIAGVVGETLARGADAVRPVARWLTREPMAPVTTPIAGWLSGLSRRGEARRAALRRELDRLLDALVPEIVDALLDRVDITAVIQDRVDLDAVVAGVDVEAVVAGVDVNRVARRIDLDDAAARLDVDAIIRRVDLDAIVDRLELARLAEQVIDDVDLPEIIRESTGAVASETVQTMRLRGVAADDVVGRAVDRLLRRSGRRPLQDRAPGSGPRPADGPFAGPASGTLQRHGDDPVPP
ncbi:MAG TPA: hypothetical protein VI248_06735 [Kineosporiaceae bacterium]